MGGGGGGGELLISAITGSVLAYQVPHKKMLCLILSLTTYRSNIVSSTQTLAQIKSQEIIDHIKQHFMTASPLTYVTNDIQDRGPI